MSLFFNEANLLPFSTTLKVLGRDLEIPSQWMCFFLDVFRGLFIISVNNFGEGKSDGP
jgi:hypothetical protein